ncbi:MAG: hypothetical protein ACREUT_01570 [Steroidobacteraceae bacterium]
MTTQELVQAASRIASGMVGASYAAQPGALPADVVDGIARLSVQIARRIEELARNPHPERSGRL